MDRGLFHYTISFLSHHILLPKFKIKNKIKLNSLFLEENSLLKELKELKMLFSSIFYYVSNNVYFNIFKVIVLGVHRNRFSQ